MLKMPSQSVILQWLLPLNKFTTVGGEGHTKVSGILISIRNHLGIFRKPMWPAQWSRGDQKIKIFFQDFGLSIIFHIHLESKSTKQMLLTLSSG